MFATLRGLYAIVDVGPETELDAAAQLGRAVLEGGCALLQLRIKGRTDRATLEVAGRLIDALRPAARRGEARPVPLLINDRADVALAVGADGVHVGLTDLSPRAARAVLGSRAVIGASSHTLAELREQLAGGHLDYVAFGPVWASATKQGHADVVGLPGLQSAAAAADRPLCAIGGVCSPEQARSARAAGADLVACISALAAADDPAAAARALHHACREEP